MPAYTVRIAGFEGGRTENDSARTCSSAAPATAALDEWLLGVHLRAVRPIADDVAARHFGLRVRLSVSTSRLRDRHVDSRMVERVTRPANRKTSILPKLSRMYESVRLWAEAVVGVDRLPA